MSVDSVEDRVAVASTATVPMFVVFKPALLPTARRFREVHLGSTRMLLEPADVPKKSSGEGFVATGPSPLVVPCKDALIFKTPSARTFGSVGSSHSLNGTDPFLPFPSPPFIAVRRGGETSA